MYRYFNKKKLWNRNTNDVRNLFTLIKKKQFSKIFLNFAWPKIIPVVIEVKCLPLNIIKMIISSTM